MNVLRVKERVGEFAENKDAAREVREQILRPQVASGQDVVVDFAGVDLATQSFVHALISDLVRDDELEALDHLIFKNCNPDVQTIISIVVDYSQEDVATSQL